MKPELPSIEMIDAVFFDFDGVILDSPRIKDEAFAELFSDLPQHKERILAHHRENLGTSRFEKFEWIYRRVLGSQITKEESASLGQRFSSLIRDRMLTCSFVPGAKPLLETLHTRVHCFVVSGTPQEELRDFVRLRELDRYFVEVCGSPETKPDILERLLGDYGLDRAATFMIGDGLTDLEAAKHCGIDFVARVDEREPSYSWPEGTAQIMDLRELSIHLGLASSA